MFYFILVLINQLALNRISFQQKNPKLGGYSPTPKDIQKNLENELILANFTNKTEKLKAIKKDANAPLNFFDWKLDFSELLNKSISEYDNPCTLT